MEKLEVLEKGKTLLKSIPLIKSAVYYLYDYYRAAPFHSYNQKGADTFHRIYAPDPLLLTKKEKIEAIRDRIRCGLILHGIISFGSFGATIDYLGDAMQNPNIQSISRVIFFGVFFIINGLSVYWILKDKTLKRLNNLFSTHIEKRG